MKTVIFLLVVAFSHNALAEEGLPSKENEFLDVIAWITPQKLVEYLGDPAGVSFVRDKETGDQVGTIVRYHYINTNDDGEYYKTTELDYLGGRLKTVIFSTSDVDESTIPEEAPENICPVEC